jgi:hypothetical protein
MSDELKERNILKLILIVRFACATLDMGHLIIRCDFGPFIRFLEVLMDKKNWEKCDMDQPVLNWIVYGGQLAAAGVKIYTVNCTGPIITLANCPRFIIKANGVQAIHNGQRKLPHIVHQWKAFDKYKEMYLKRCDMTDYMRKLEETTGIRFNWTAPVQAARGSLAW